MTEIKAQKTAIVIGAGVGGVATAARLARAGFKVTVVEKNDFNGGRCSLIHHEGWRFDQGPSLLLLPQLFRQTFADLDTTLENEGVHLLKCDPNYNMWFHDGEKIRLSTDLAAMKTEIEKWEGKDGFMRYLDFLKEAHEHYELGVSQVLLRNFTNIWSFLRTSIISNLPRMHPFENMYGRSSRYFFTERLRRAFTFGSMYMGMSPFDAPGTYSLLQYTELAEGIWYPVGGFNKIIQALVAIGERLGVEYRYSAPVAKIILGEDGKNARGVLLASGEGLHADIVVNNSDLVYAYNNLLPEVTPYSKSLNKRETSCSSISFYWALDRKVPELEAHNIFLADQYKESFDSIFRKHLIPEDPSFYVNVPSRVDPSAAPEGQDSVVVLVPVGHLLDKQMPSTRSIHQPEQAKLIEDDSSVPGLLPLSTQDWPELISFARRTILATIAMRTGVDISPFIRHEITNDPTTWQQKFNLDRGAILGLSHSFFNVLSFRPSTRARRSGTLDHKIETSLTSILSNFLPHENSVTIASACQRIAEIVLPAQYIQNLYFVGASTHPGTGVPICLAGAKLVSEQIIGDAGLRVPWMEAKVESETRMFGLMGKTGHSLDERLPIVRVSWWHGLFLIVLWCLAWLVGLVDYFWR